VAVLGQCNVHEADWSQQLGQIRSLFHLNQKTAKAANWPPFELSMLSPEFSLESAKTAD
jgi:hypothetical protein